MSYDELHVLLDEDGSDAPAELNDDERWLMRHLAVAAAALPNHADLYRHLLVRRESEGPSEDVRAVALDAAGTTAVLLQSVRRRTRVLIAASETWLSPTLALGALDQLFYSFALLTTPAEEHSEARLTPEELDELLAQPELQAWLIRIGAESAGG